VSSLFKNIRLHYIDVRDILYYFLINTFWFAETQIDRKHDFVAVMIETAMCVALKFIKYVVHTLQTKNFPQVGKKQLITNPYEHTEDFLLKPKIQQRNLEYFVYLLNKLINQYKHDDDVKQLINHYMYSYLLPEWENFTEYLTTFHNGIKNLTSEDYKHDLLINILKEKIINLRDYAFSINSRIVDLYFLRRFLDKDYITNAITYTGAAHSVAFIYILKKLGFKITHCANCIIKNVNELNEKVSVVKKFPMESSLFDLLDLFVQPGTKQCTDISDFPKDFE
jgi:hypothetical protein